jgi:hypothetical protein
MLTTLNCEGNANQNDIEIPPHSSQNGYHQQHKKQQMLMKMQRGGEGIGKRKNTFHL